MIRTGLPHESTENSCLGKPERESPMDDESETGRWFIFSEECAECNGTGKLALPGVPDCPRCQGTGVMDTCLNKYAGKDPKVGSILQI